MSLYKKSEIPEHLQKYFEPAEIGLEQTPEDYVNELVQVFREVRRVLRDDGTLWLNLGDSYFGGKCTGKQPKDTNGVELNRQSHNTLKSCKHCGKEFLGLPTQNFCSDACGGVDNTPCQIKYGFKHKDLIGIPWLIAKALQAPYYTGKIKDDIDRTWLAAMIDAEGSICGFYHERKDDGSPRTGIHINITNSDERILKKAFEIYPSASKHVHMKNSDGHLGNKTTYRWHVFSIEGKQNLISEIYPYLISKKKQAKIAWNFLEYQKKAKHYGKTPQKQKVRDLRKQMVEWISQLNHGEDIELPLWMKEPPSLYEDGWYLRQDIIWCLSGGNWVYVKSQKGVMPMMIKDLYRLKPETVQLWNGEKWTNLLGMSKSERVGNEIELVLRSGERISCTPTHKFPTSRGLLEASDIVKGDVLATCILPDNENPLDCAIGELAGWFAGLYIAEGSMAGDTIQIAGHVKEEARWSKIQDFAKMYGGSVTRTVSGNKMDVRVYGKIPNAIINELVSGRTAIDKCFSPVCWQYSNEFLDSMLQGYLEGDGHNDVKNNRWRLGFTRNYNLERDLRTVCARLGYKLILNTSTVKYKDENRPTFRGEIRKVRSEHLNNKQCGEVVEIRNARCRFVYDLGVEDEPHVFALASGVLTHNSKNNPMPESVRDRCTKSHEYIFLFSKSAKYYFDNEAIKEPAVSSDDRIRDRESTKLNHVPGRTRMNGLKTNSYTLRNKRSVWNVNNVPYKGSHFACFPPTLINPCILSGCPENGIVLDPFGGSGTVGQVCNSLNRNAILIELNPEYKPLIIERINSKPKSKKKKAVSVEKVTLQQNLIQYFN